MTILDPPRTARAGTTARSDREALPKEPAAACGPDRAWRDEWRYRWNNTANPGLLALHRAVDRYAPPGPAQVSTVAGGASLAYAGLPVGRLNVLGLMERQRARLAPGECEVSTEPTAWRRLVAGDVPDADIVFVGGESGAVRRLPAARALVAPFRIHLVVDTDTDPETLRSRVSKRERWEYNRNSRRFDWRLVPSDDVGDLSLFYERMHRPTMRVRHAEQSRTESWAVTRNCLARHGRLFLLHQDGVPVAGVLCHRAGRTLTTRLLGVLDGSDEHYDSGAFKAVYHLLLDHACRTPDIDAVDFFGTEAIVSKGIYQWKRKLGPRVVLPPNHFRSKRLHMAVRQDTPAVRDLLVANPILAYVDGDLRPCYFHDADRPARTDISAKAGGVGEPLLVDLDEFLAGP